MNMQRISAELRTRQTVAAFSAGVMAVLTISGCEQHRSRSLFELDVPQHVTRDIEPVDLLQRSQSQPQTIEQASESLMDSLVMPAQPAPSVELSLADVRAASLRNNLDLQVQLLEPTIAQTAVDEEEAKFEAAFAASYFHQDSESPTALATEGSEVTSDSFNFGINVPLETGGTINLSLPFNRIETNNPFSLLDPAFSAAAEFSISQPLFRNAGTRTNTHSIRVARGQRSIADARTKLEAIRILANADRAYWIVYAARRELDVRVEQYQLAMTQLERARRLVEAGEAPNIEVIRAESGVAQRLEAIIIARTQLNRAQRDLKRIINREDLPLNSATQFALITEPRPLGLELDADELSEFAIANRMEMLELELQLAIDASTIAFQRNQALPLITLDYTYRLSGLGSSFDRAFNQVGDADFGTWAVGLSANIPIGNEATEARVHRAILQRLQRLATKDLRTQSIRQEVLDALDQLQQDWQRILAARQEVILAARTYEAETRQFDNGLRTSTDVLDAAANLADAQSREIRALADYQIAMVDIAFATGTLLGHGRVRWEPTVPHGDD